MSKQFLELITEPYVARFVYLITLNKFPRLLTLLKMIIHFFLLVLIIILIIYDIRRSIQSFMLREKFFKKYFRLLKLTVTLDRFLKMNHHFVGTYTGWLSLIVG